MNEYNHACVPGTYFPEVNRLGSEVNHSPPSSTYLQWSLSVSEEHSMKVLERCETQKRGRVWRYVHNDDLRNLHLFVILRVMTNGLDPERFVFQKYRQESQVRSIFLSISTCLVPYGSLITAIRLKATDFLDTDAVLLPHIRQTHYFRKSSTFSHGPLHYWSILNYVH